MIDLAQRRALARVERASNPRGPLPEWEIDVRALARARAAAMDDATTDALAVEVMRRAQLGIPPREIADDLHVAASIVGRVLGYLNSPPSATTRPVRTFPAGAGGGDPLTPSHHSAASAATE